MKFILFSSFCNISSPIINPPNSIAVSGISSRFMLYCLAFDPILYELAPFFLCTSFLIPSVVIFTFRRQHLRSDFSFVPLGHLSRSGKPASPDLRNLSHNHRSKHQPAAPQFPDGQPLLQHDPSSQYRKYGF